jgi:antitoxin component YwqK of YwqJK toxin-antitoxin module
MIGYKVCKAEGDTWVLVTLEIPADALTNVDRGRDPIANMFVKSLVNKETASYRTNKARVLQIEDEAGNTYNTCSSFLYGTKSLVYTVGELVTVDDYDTWPDNTCSSGIHFFLNRRVAELYYKEDKVNGLYQEWHPNGILEKECTYLEGKLHGLYRIWTDNGNLIEECTYVEGTLHGLYRRWYTNGEKEVECTFVDGVHHGDMVAYHRGGQMMEKCAYVHGKKNGVDTFWDKRGKMISQEIHGQS